MQAAQIIEYGDPSVVTVNEVEKPSPSAEQVLVEVHAASLNPFDTSLRAGYMKEMIPLHFPSTLGGDIAGIVTEVGKDVTTLAVGDKVYGQANVVAGSSGAFAEFAVTGASQVAKQPENLDFKQAASLPLVGVSALQALTEHIKLQPGQKIFIHGGAGGIGTVAIQIAKHIGAYVATTATGESVTNVKSLGADEVVDYAFQDFVAVLSNYDAVFDTVGGKDYNKALSILKRGGTAVSMIGKADEARAKELGVATIAQHTKVTTKALDELSNLIETHVVTPHVKKVFPLSQVREAFEAREKGSVQGKVVLEIK